MRILIQPCNWEGFAGFQGVGVGKRRLGARLDHLSLLQPQGDGVVRDAKLADSLLNGDLVEKHKCAKFAQSS